MESFHRSIANELESIKDRVRSLIGDSHWPTDGSFKEAILRTVLDRHIGNNALSGSGFVCTSDSNTKQIDILIIKRNFPILFENSGIFFVTPDCVNAIIEVKTQLNSSNLDKAIKQVADNLYLIRQHNANCLGGLIAYNDGNNITPKKVLKALQRASEGEPLRAINWVTIGKDSFFHFWPNGTDVYSPICGPVWHAYYLEGLATGYFISNIICETCSVSPEFQRSLWFPIPEGKETRRSWYIGITQREATEFSSAHY